MSKILIAADIHIHDYPQYNLKPGFRLGQFKTLAKKLVSIGSDSGCFSMIIAGDILHQSTPRPYVQHAIIEFFEILTSWFDDIHICHGQHDMDTRSGTKNQDTILGIVAKACSSNKGKIHYHRDEFANIKGLNVYFRGWEPEFNVPKDLSGDIFIGHATAANSLVGQEARTHVIKSGLEIDLPQFKRVFLGDVHRHQTHGNVVAIGVPIQHSFSDHSDTGVILLNSKDLSWERRAVCTTGNKFLRFLITDDQERYEDDEYVVTKPKTAPTAKSKITLTKTINLISTIEEAVEQSGLKDIHQKLFQLVDATKRTDIDMNFKLESICIKNFRSIDHLFYDFKSGGITKLLGDNGSGKSTFITALHFAFFGGNARKLSKRKNTGGDGSLEVTLVLNYQDCKHCITRGWSKDSGYLLYTVDGEDISRDSKGALEEEINRRLDFLQMFDLVFHQQDRSGFLSSYRFKDRVALISNVLGLGLVEDLFSLAAKKAGDLDTKINDKLLEIDRCSAIIENAESVEVEIPNEDQLKLEIADLNKILPSINNALSDVNRINDLSARIDEVSRSLKGKSKIDEEPLRKSLEGLREMHKNIEKQATERRKRLSECNTVNARIDSTIATKQHEVNNLKENVCFVCKREIPAELRNRLTLEIQKSLDELVRPTEEINKLEESLVNLERSLSGLRKKEGEWEVRINNAEHNNSELTRLTSTIAEHSGSKGTIESKLTIHLSSTKLADNVSAKELQGLSSETAAKISMLEERVTQAQKLKKLKDSIQDAKEKIKLNKPEIEEARASLNRYNQYLELVAPQGSIIMSVLEAVSNALSDEVIRIKAYKVLVGGEKRPGFLAEMNVQDTWLEYETDLSGGQKVIVDLHILQRLASVVGGLGLLVFDETLKSLGVKETAIAVDIIKEAAASDIFIISNLQDFPYFDNEMQFKLIKGTSQIITT